MSKRFGPRPGPKPRRPFATHVIVATNEPGSKAEVPSCPASLTSAQKVVYRTTVAELASTKGWLQRADRACLVAFSIHTVNFRAAQKHVDTEGSVFNVLDKNGQITGQRVSKWVEISQAESALAVKCGDRLGLNPSSRQTSHVEPQRPQGPDELTPPNRHVSLERTLSLTETVFQEPEDKSLFDLPDPVDQDKVVPPAIDPVVELPTAAEPVANPDDVATVEPSSAEAVAEAPVKKKTVNWPFPRFP